MKQLRCCREEVSVIVALFSAEKLIVNKFLLHSQYEYCPARYFWRLGALTWLIPLRSQARRHIIITEGFLSSIFVWRKIGQVMRSFEISSI